MNLLSNVGEREVLIFFVSSMLLNKCISGWFEFRLPAKIFCKCYIILISTCFYPKSFWQFLIGFFGNVCNRLRILEMYLVSLSLHVLMQFLIGAFKLKIAFQFSCVFCFSFNDSATLPQRNCRTRTFCCNKTTVFRVCGLISKMIQLFKYCLNFFMPEPYFFIQQLLPDCSFKNSSCNVAWLWYRWWRLILRLIVWCVIVLPLFSQTHFNVFRHNIRSIINLQRPGEHASCGPPLEKESLFTYRPQVFMDNDSKHWFLILPRFLLYMPKIIGVVLFTFSSWANLLKKENSVFMRQL